MPIVLLGLALAAVVMLLFGGTPIDRNLLLLLSPGGQPAWQSVAELIGAATGRVPLLAAGAAGAVWLFYRSEPRQALLLAGIILSGMLMLALVTQVTDGLRPALDDRLGGPAPGGFLDAHAAGGAIVGTALAFLLTRHAPARGLALAAAAALPIAAGTARLLVGAAWPSDVIGGWALGLFWPLLLLVLARADLGDGTARPLRHSPSKGERHGQSEDRDRPPE